ncbi:MULTISPECIES: hypothetical protein [Moraxella]|uniref:Uncharacterized protein n=1 Tax=Moraxella lacunata TaxID=477 RepID=A0A1B8PY73_MORLA|nr:MULTISPECIES: hypothetical protein [Moraxella]MDH9219791.1 hypothetical protein [Moraxella lacunata]OBX61016.1 hypothetical protein A9309_09050 [Moraxella lacunata]OBX61170.1 hypothetical protein A9Z63_08525 [Moraxella lacunata]OPH35977.1 hypothetical protein B5J94_08465 [Moraxella lacunata]
MDEAFGAWTRGNLIQILVNWHSDDLPLMMFIKKSPNSHAFVRCELDKMVLRVHMFCQHCGMARMLHVWTY